VPQEEIQSSADALDFSDEQPQVPVGTNRPDITPYDPRPHEDQARRHIAYALIALLWVLVGGVLIQVSFGSIPIGDIKEYAVLIGPVVALVSAATGFYYGTKTQANG
jgi:hypothetical protein